MFSREKVLVRAETNSSILKGSRPNDLTLQGYIPNLKLCAISFIMQRRLLVINFSKSSEGGCIEHDLHERSA